MKGIAILGLLFALGGCASLTSLEELEAQAMLTGDWSAVERRERIIAQRQARKGPQCPPGAVALCMDNIGRDRCSCVKDTVIHSLMGGH